MEERRIAILEKIYSLTASSGFSYDPEDAEADIEIYAKLYEEREELMKELASVNEELKDGPPDLAARELLSKILELDKEYKVFAEKLKHNSKEQLRLAKQAQTVNRKFNDRVETGGMLLDSKS